MDINFPLLLVIAVAATGVIALADKLVFLPRRRAAVASYKSGLTGDFDQTVVDSLEQPPSIIETSVSIFPVLALVLVLRSFLFEPFQIPSGSMIPTLEVGDFILVNKFDYGLRLPVSGTKIWSNNDPQRGEVMVFKEPQNPNINFIKRVIGVPGDEVRYVNKQLTINGKKMDEELVARLNDGHPHSLFNETIGDSTHRIRKDQNLRSLMAEGIWTVPEGMYFVMGDNRDRSNDSRYWGFVPEQNIVGKAVYIWMHWPNWTKLPNFKNNGSIH